ncbi:fused MFS/spermidine synthase [Kribbella sp. NPDC006257]|uniref:spermidine synthase n=1 Tax=Kribbella sp. NPDC006257 TaxID=3156738 RepID=UPI0033A1A2D7
MERKVGSGVATVEAEADGTFVLRVDGSLQSQVDLADPTHLSFEYVRRIGDVLDAVAARRQPISVLHIGGAGLTLARYVAATRPRSRQIVLEPDEDLTDFVREALPLPKRAGIKVRPVTGRAGIADIYPDSVDVVIVDAFVHEAVPANLVTAEFTTECSRVLRPTGLLIFNLIDGSAGLNFVRRVAATLLTHLTATTPGGEGGGGAAAGGVGGGGLRSLWGVEGGCLGVGWFALPGGVVKGWGLGRVYFSASVRESRHQSISQALRPVGFSNPLMIPRRHGCNAIAPAGRCLISCLARQIRPFLMVGHSVRLRCGIEP